MQNLDAFCDLERVANGAAERFIHRAKQMRHLHAHQLTNAYHRSSKLFRLAAGFHESAAAEFHVEHEPIEAFRQLLAHDACYNQRLGRDCSGHVAQCIKFLVSRTDVLRLSNHEDADLVELLERAPFIEIHIESGNAFEFVERSTGEAEPATGNHRHPHFIAGTERRHHQRGLVANAAGGVFVDLRRRFFRIL